MLNTKYFIFKSQLETEMLIYNAYNNLTSSLLLTKVAHKFVSIVVLR